MAATFPNDRQIPMCNKVQALIGLEDELYSFMIY